MDGDSKNVECFVMDTTNLVMDTVVGVNTFDSTILGTNRLICTYVRLSNKQTNCLMYYIFVSRTVSYLVLHNSLYLTLRSIDTILLNTGPQALIDSGIDADNITDTIVPLADHFQILAVTFDSKLTIDKHINEAELLTCLKNALAHYAVYYKERTTSSMVLLSPIHWLAVHYCVKF